MSQEEVRQKVKDFLERHHKCVLATVGKDEHPTTSLMLYCTDDELAMYFGTRKSFGKYKVFEKHPYASASVVEEGLDPLRTVEIRGKIEFISEEKTAEMHAFFESKNKSSHYVKGAEDFVMFKIIPSFIRWLDATTGQLIKEELTLPHQP